MVEKIYSAPDIFRIEVPLPNNPLRYLNSYVLRGSERSLVIDTGFRREECRQALFSGLRELKIELSRTDLFLTHLHADHTGLVNDFVKKGSRVFMHPVDYQYLQDFAAGRTWPFLEKQYRLEGMSEADLRSQKENQARKFSAYPDFKICPVMDHDQVKLGGEWFQAIHVPGHTAGQLCLYLPRQQILFTADHILFDITPNIQVWPNLPNALQCYLNSLDKVRDLPVHLALPGHRKGSTSIRQRIDAIQQHHERRLGEVIRVIRQQEGASGIEIAPRLHWSMRGKKWEEFPPTQKWFALGETEAHLEYLLRAGKIRREEKNHLRHYYTVNQEK